jgi:hypothetical protein
MEIEMPLVTFARRGLAIVLFAVVAGCSHVPVSTMYKLWSFDVLAADPAAIRAAARYPASLAPRPGGAKLTLTITGAKGGAPDVRVYVLEETTEAPELTQVSPYRRDGYPIRVYRLSEQDAANVRALLKELREAKQRAEQRSGSIGVAIDACHTGEMPKKAILTSTYLKLVAASGYMTVLEDVDLRKEVGDTDLAKNVPPCAPS